MPNTKSAERRMRNSDRKNQQNQQVKSRLKTLERRFLENVKAGKKDEATKALSEAASGLDKAAKTGVIHPSRADRKKSRLSVRLAAVK
ncbi:MAG: 30S ribosomal protein S20 [Verrucomicrobiota bacterium]|jgi:small subunit ribosomal protein S20